MSYVIAITAGLCIWIVLWALNISGFDAMFFAIGFVVIVSGLRSMIARVPSRKD